MAVAVVEGGGWWVGGLSLGRENGSRGTQNMERGGYGMCVGSGARLGAEVAGSLSPSRGGVYGLFGGGGLARGVLQTRKTGNPGYWMRLMPSSTPPPTWKLRGGGECAAEFRGYYSRRNREHWCVWLGVEAWDPSRGVSQGPDDDWFPQRTPPHRSGFTRQLGLHTTA